MAGIDCIALATRGQPVDQNCVGRFWCIVRFIEGKRDCARPWREGCGRRECLGRLAAHTGAGPERRTVYPGGFQNQCFVRAGFMTFIVIPGDRHIVHDQRECERIGYRHGHIAAGVINRSMGNARTTWHPRGYRGR